MLYTFVLQMDMSKLFNRQLQSVMTFWV